MSRMRHAWASARRVRGALGTLGAFALAVAFALVASDALAVIATTKHNLSTSGTGTYHASTESQICVFCHAPHNAAPTSALWNRRTPGTTYTPYTSSTSKAAMGQPTGASLQCLSCHDGTIALGEVLSRATAIAMAGGTTLSGSGLLGTDLSDDHPVSFAYTSALASTRGGLVDPGGLTGRVKLDGAGQMQCTSCHDPHDDTNGKFLTVTNLGSALCSTCHIPTGWANSSHKNSGAGWNGTGTNPWPHTSYTNVSSNGCENCHRPHAAGGPKRLLNFAGEETNCYSCHAGTVASKNIQAEFNKAYKHPIGSTTGVHDPAESAVVNSRHVECVDCHNSHASQPTTGGTLAGSLTGARGVGIAGGETSPVTNEYQICFRCHADSSGKPAPYTTRQLIQSNLRLEFSTSNPSYHPVAGPGRNPNVPSLISPLTTASVISCVDCHNNSTTGGPRGSHGSTYKALLERQNITTDNTPESSTAYALCYKCHSRTSLMADASRFPHHQHVADVRAPCNVCHDPHGVGGTLTNNSKLINFQSGVVTPSSGGILRYESTGTFQGRCYLTCHGKNHNPYSYR